MKDINITNTQETDSFSFLDNLDKIDKIDKAPYNYNTKKHSQEKRKQARI